MSSFEGIEQQLYAEFKNVEIGIKYPSVMIDLMNKQELPPELTEEEIQCLDPKFLYDNNSYHQLKNPRNFSDKCLTKLWERHAYPLVLIREAYFKLRKDKTDIDIVQLLKDDLSKYTLFQLVTCLRRVKDYSVCLAEIRVSLLQNIPEAPQPTPGILVRKRCRNSYPFSVPCQSEGNENLSKNIYPILLILKEILSTMQVNDKSQVSEGHTTFVNSSSIDSPELMGLVMAGITQLKKMFSRERCLLEKLIGSVHDVFPPTTVEYREANVCNEKFKNLSKELYRELLLSYSCLGSAEFAFKDIREMIYRSFILFVEI